MSQAGVLAPDVSRHATRGRSPATARDVRGTSVKAKVLKIREIIDCTVFECIGCGN